MNYPLRETNVVCRLIGHRYGPMYYAAGHVRQTCRLDGHTFPRFGTVPQSREDYDDWVDRGCPTSEPYGDWLPAVTMGA